MLGCVSESINIRCIFVQGCVDIQSSSPPRDSGFLGDVSSSVVVKENRALIRPSLRGRMTRSSSKRSDSVTGSPWIVHATRSSQNVRYKIILMSAVLRLHEVIARSVVQGFGRWGWLQRVTSFWRPEILPSVLRQRSPSPWAQWHPYRPSCLRLRNTSRKTENTGRLVVFS